MKINSSLLDFKQYNLQCDINTMRKNKWLVSLADSQALRTIRKIRYSRDPNITRYNNDVLEELKRNKKRISRQKYSNESYEETVLSIPYNVLAEMGDEDISEEMSYENLRRYIPEIEATFTEFMKKLSEDYYDDIEKYML